MRFLYAVLCLLLIAWAAFAGPPAQHPKKLSQCPGRDPGAIVAKPQILGCVCGDDCKCQPGSCPTKCPVNSSGVIVQPQYQYVQPQQRRGIFGRWREQSFAPSLTPVPSSEYTSPFNLQCSGPA